MQSLRKTGCGCMPNLKNPDVRAIFLDRDGILNRDVGYAFRESDLSLVPGIVEFLCLASNSGYKLVVITNQSGIARGKFEVRDMHHFNMILEDCIVRAGGPKFDAVYWCPHLPEGKIPIYSIHCQCRKPAPGMIAAATKYFGINAALSFMIGDKISDMECASNAGVRGIQVGPGATSPVAYAHVQSISEARGLI
jgi:D-glycero-D-manno-heptose 1,7-bisphosphate phosphatase